MPDLPVLAADRWATPSFDVAPVGEPAEVERGRANCTASSRSRGGGGAPERLARGARGHGVGPCRAMLVRGVRWAFPPDLLPWDPAAGFGVSVRPRRAGRSRVPAARGRGSWAGRPRRRSRQARSEHQGGGPRAASRRGDTEICAAQRSPRRSRRPRGDFFRGGAGPSDVGRRRIAATPAVRWPPKRPRDRGGGGLKGPGALRWQPKRQRAVRPLEPPSDLSDL